MTEAIHIHNISKSFRIWRASLKISVIEDLSLTISESESVLLLGPNGSGKSTLLRMVATLLFPSKGKIRIYGYDTRRRSRSLLNLIGFMAEECKFHPGISGLTFLCYLGKLIGIKKTRERAEEILEQFGLSKWSNIDVSVYSEGMRQRLGLCSAFLNKPKILLFDEPYDNLDQEMRTNLKDYLQEYVELGNIVVAASHNKEHFANFRKVQFPIRRER